MLKNDKLIVNEQLLLSSFMILYSIFPSAIYLSPFVCIWGWVMIYFELQLKIPFTIDLLLFVRHLKVFSDSIRSLKIHRKTLFFPILFFFCLKTPSLPFWASLWLCALILKFFLMKKKKSISDYPWNFSHENFRLLSSQYPLLRKTHHFLGEKQIQIKTSKKPHIFFLFLESFRAQNIGALGAEIPFSPNFDAWTKRGTLFTQFYANGLQTYRALIASFFGVPAQIETMSLRPFCSIPMIGLPQILKNHGYKCAHFQGNCTSFDWSFSFLKKAGFDLIKGDEHFPHRKKTSWGLHDEELYDIAFEFLQNETQPIFLSLFTISNHHPWHSPMKFQVPTNLPQIYQNYLQTFSYTDYCLGNFLKRLEKSNILENSVLFILADHGQKMGSSFEFHNDLSQENVHIPLLILNTPETRIDTPSSQIDLMPTVLDLLNLKTIHHGVGKSLLRKAETPVYISMAKKQGEFRRIPQTSSKEDETNIYFQSLEKLFQEKRLAPVFFESQIFEKKAPKQAKDAWIANLHDSVSILDLSYSHISDHGLSLLKKRKDLHELNLRYSAFLTDLSLEWIANHCPNLSILNLSYCPFFTEKGIEILLEKLPSLKMLSLEGNQNLTKIPLKKKSYLEALHLNRCPNLSENILIEISKKFPHLKYLSISLENIQNEQLLKCKMKSLQYLFLENGEQIETAPLNAFLKNQRQLQILILNHFPKIQKIDTSHLHTFQFQNCPNLR